MCGFRYGFHFDLASGIVVTGTYASSKEVFTMAWVIVNFVRKSQEGLEIDSLFRREGIQWYCQREKVVGCKSLLIGGVGES